MERKILNIGYLCKVNQTMTYKYNNIYDSLHVVVKDDAYKIQCRNLIFYL